jgi:hypothetical protein
VNLEKKLRSSKKDKMKAKLNLPEKWPIAIEKSKIRKISKTISAQTDIIGDEKSDREVI